MSNSSLVLRASSWIKVGCCGFAESQAKCFRDFRLVEIQQTFYDPPRVSTAERWRGAAPDDFEFALKAWQLITHPATSPTYRRLRRPLPDPKRCRYGFFQPTDEVFEAWERTLEIAVVLRAPIVVFQCPASFTPTAEHIVNLRRFFETVSRTRPSDATHPARPGKGGRPSSRSALRAQHSALRFVWEPRGDWPANEIKALCQDLDLIHGVNPFKDEPVHGKPAYFRLHGVSGYNYRFSDADLQKLASFCQTHQQVYCLFNNVSMLPDARRFMRLVNR